MSNILLVDDEKSILDSLERTLEEEGYQILTTNTGRGALRKLKEEQIVLMLLDLRLPDMSGIEVLRKARDIQRETLIIVVTGYGTIETAVEAIKLGAYDYIKKPFKGDSIKLIVKLALETQTLKKEVKELRREVVLGDDEIVGESRQIMDVLNLINGLAKKETTALLLVGETGTGKERIAKTIHAMSDRCSHPFIQINCAAVPPHLLESEFFGHEKGAFTDAKERKIGLFEVAQGGTILLDEIGDMDIHLQSKLLNVLDERRFRRVGGVEKIDFKARIISSTNRDLNLDVKEGRFRADLYYRLNVLPISIPPLRERGDDVILLVNHFMREFNKKFNRKFETVSEEAIHLLKTYAFPGNVRELKNMIERILLVYDEKTILPEHLPVEVREVNAKADSLYFHLPSYGGNDFPRDGLDFNRLVDTTLNQLRKEVIENVLRVTRGNKQKAAKLLKLSRSALGRHLDHLKKD